MRVNKIYLKASFVSFLIHAFIILYSLDFFYYESQPRSVLSKPINVNLVFKEEIQKKTKINQSQKKKVDIVEKSEKLILDDNVDNRLSFDSLINSSNIQDLIKEDELISKESEENQIEMFSSLVIQSLQSAWRKPINIQDGLVCNLRLTINKNGRVLSANLIKSSGNIRFDNSALKAVQRVETFGFFNEIPLNIYSSNFKNIVITFNPS
ncbi:MAG: TonB family protein [Gammaproteobacteria bacterium]|tara:strand:- start:7890 stop:8516 length:627 start_codon:yes stop_codon:yes gene_type:complete